MGVRFYLAITTATKHVTLKCEGKNKLFEGYYITVLTTIWDKPVEISDIGVHYYGEKNCYVYKKKKYIYNTSLDQILNTNRTKLMDFYMAVNIFV